MSRNEYVFQKREINHLFDRLYVLLPKQNERHLAELLAIFPATLSNMRARRVKIGSSLLLKLALHTGFGVKEIKAYLRGENPSLENRPFCPVQMHAEGSKTYSESQVSLLFDHIMAENKLRNDRQLAEFLGVYSPVISKMRLGRLTIGPSLLEKIQEKTEKPISEVIGMLVGQDRIPSRKKYVLYRSEKPEKTLDAYLNDLEKHIQQIRNGVKSPTEVEEMVGVVLALTHFELQPPSST